MRKDVIREIEKDIGRYSPCPQKVRLVAVSKYVGPEIMAEAVEDGIRIFGENRAQSFRDKKAWFDEKKIGGVSWHFIGNLQKNKVKYIIEDVQLIHSVNSLGLAAEIDRQAGAKGRKVDVLLEVNVSGEESKEGYSIKNLENELERLTKLQNIHIIGLMTMAPLTENETEIRNCFGGLRKLTAELNKSVFHGQLTELSMGMTNDYKIALSEGATLLRIGSKLFL
ncbi:MAG: YggS family pyridoxal phosphate-dependent enzyme [Fusobacteriaceae bacterium]|jgi:pyridoxal phosphate enzyme (YggS family)|nr:YggS family pyridoxal phosphate-dependent enzyme [Fusobacteriaceae bacterium]